MQTEVTRDARKRKKAQKKQEAQKMAAALKRKKAHLRFIPPPLPSGAFGAHRAWDAFGGHGLLRAAPLATNCWLEAPLGGGGGAGVFGVLRQAESRLPPC